MLDLPNSANSQKMPQNLKNVQDSNKTQIKPKNMENNIQIVKNCKKNSKTPYKMSKNRKKILKFPKKS